MVLGAHAHVMCVWGNRQEHVVRKAGGRERLMLTVDGCGYGDGACAARIDMAKSVREGLDSISPAKKVSEK